MNAPARAGRAEPLGAHWDGRGVSFALFSANATSVELCLFDSPETPTESRRIELPGQTDDVWHAYVEGLAPGQLYGYRVHGPWAPDQGHLFNPAKLLVDPYARALCGPLRWNEALRSYRPGHTDEPDQADSAPFVPRCVVTAGAGDHTMVPGPAVPQSRTIVYECHVKGATVLHPKIPRDHQGRYLGIASREFIDHLLDLGVTTVELMPVQHATQDEHLFGRNLPNYWGYSTLGFFAPDHRFATNDRGQQVEEFRQMVNGLHTAGLEVLLDVVLNHTPEGGPGGPTLSLRGIDNASYYRLHGDDPSQYEDFTGCGNTLDASHPRVRQLFLDNLRYWAGELGVDGFRFDLAPVLAREPFHFNGSARLFEMIRQDPLLSRCKLVAEPWDLGPEGYRLGGFPSGWTEWNDRFRDGTRRFWHGFEAQLPDFSSRIFGSRDIFPAPHREGPASTNYVCSHDGFCLEDLVSYNRKHNQANREGGRDGPHDESYNWGVEGPSRDPMVRQMRERGKRNLTLTLFLSQGTPMWLAGDELSRTQQGNNNPYCQDNEISWFDWDLSGRREAFLAFVKQCIALRKGNAVFRRRHFEANDEHGIAWLRPDGAPMRPEDWTDPEHSALMLLLDASVAEEVDEYGSPQEARTIVWLINGGPRQQWFALPLPPHGENWIERVNTAYDGDERRPRARKLRLAPYSSCLLEEGPVE